MQTSFKLLAVLCLFVSTFSHAGTREWVGNWVGECTGFNSEKSGPDTLRIELISAVNGILVIRATDSISERIFSGSDDSQTLVSEFANGFVYDLLKTSSGIKDPNSGRIRKCQESESFTFEQSSVDRAVTVSRSQNTLDYCMGRDSARHSPLVEVTCEYTRSK